MEDRDFKGIWIPKEVWLNNNLTPGEKIYLALYTQHNNKELAEDAMAHILSKRALNDLYNSLVEKGFIYRELTPEAAKAATIKLSGTGGTCEWCGNKCYVLHRHHFPIPQSKGGTETVLICPNCHTTYHRITGE